jgi:hypothetical protein
MLTGVMQSHACVQGYIRCSAGLTALDKLVLVAPKDDPNMENSIPIAPSSAALGCMTKLTCLQLQVSSICQESLQEHKHSSYMLCMHSVVAC